jgi:hypothetical protein
VHLHDITVYLRENAAAGRIQWVGRRAKILKLGNWLNRAFEAAYSSKRKGAPVTVSSPNVTEIKLDRLIDDMRLLRSQMIAFDKHLKGIEGGGPRFISPCKVDRRTLRTAPTLFSLQNTALDTLAMLDSVIRDVGSMSGLALGLSTRGDKALVRNEARNGFRRSYAALIST